MRILRTIKWLLNHPPVDTDCDPKKFKPCSYCGELGKSVIQNYVGIFSICAKCQKKAFDKVLKKKSV